MHVRSRYISLDLPTSLNLSEFPFNFASQELNPGGPGSFKPPQAECQENGREWCVGEDMKEAFSFCPGPARSMSVLPTSESVRPNQKKS